MENGRFTRSDRVPVERPSTADRTERAEIMNESRRLTLRELRVLHETERALLHDARLAALFRDFGEKGTAPADGPDPSRRLWLLAGVCVLLAPALMVLHPGAGALVFLSAATVGAVSWAGHRGGHRGSGPGSG
jgi:hypothetical protein